MTKLVGETVPKRQKIEHRQLEMGYEFSPASYRLDSSMVSTYCEVVEETSSLYQDAELVAFLASERASYITAQVICIDGGVI